MSTLNLNVSVEEANLILEALGAMPFVKVYALIGKIQEQAARQLNSSSNGSGTVVIDDPESTIEGETHDQ